MSLSKPLAQESVRVLAVLKASTTADPSSNAPQASAAAATNGSSPLGSVKFSGELLA